jgi:inosine-uridine nucleoside N-ribohydrolase
MDNNPYWLDLELREDIDDYLTLIYALEQDVNIQAVSIHNPSQNELNLLHKTLSLFNCKAQTVVAGNITEYQSGKDIHPTLMAMSKGGAAPAATHTTLLEYIALLSNTLTDEDRAPTVFCGGSLYTLSKLLQCFPDIHWNACIQGGYAGPSLVGEHNTLKKFRRREHAPTWNLNLDLDATEVVIGASNLSAHFVSKNVCHDAWVDKKDISSSDTLFNRVLYQYFEQSKWDNKCMHDLLAFMTQHDPELVTFKPVTLHHTSDERAKWSSTLSPGSNKAISVAFDKQRFSGLIRSYDTKVRLSFLEATREQTLAANNDEREPAIKPRR